MAPTEILAAQHAAKLADIFEGTHVSVGLLTGSMTAKQHKQLLNEIKAGTINLVVGTHALIQDKVDYANLGLAIIDEQHRFGVRQRQLLREKGENPDVLAMTATPIPRTLAITTYGEMDVRSLTVPAGREASIEIAVGLRENQERSRAVVFKRTAGRRRAGLCSQSPD